MDIVPFLSIIRSILTGMEIEIRVYGIGICVVLMCVLRSEIESESFQTINLPISIFRCPCLMIDKKQSRSPTRTGMNIKDVSASDLGAILEAYLPYVFLPSSSSMYIQM